MDIAEWTSDFQCQRSKVRFMTIPYQGRYIWRRGSLVQLHTRTVNMSIIARTTCAAAHTLRGIGAI